MFREATGAAADLEDRLTRKVPRPGRLLEEPRLRDADAAVAVVLGSGVADPLEAEARRVVVDRYEPRDIAHDWEGPLAGRARQRALDQVIALCALARRDLKG